MKKSIEVTPSIIARAVARDSGHCVIADAIKASRPSARHIAVDLQWIVYSEPSEGKRYWFATPPAVQKVLLEFDMGLEIKPGSFKLPVRPALTRPYGRAKQLQTRRQDQKVVNPGTRRQSPIVEGGPAPPTAVLSNRRGRRRVFGLRSVTGGLDPLALSSP